MRVTLYLALCVAFFMSLPFTSCSDFYLSMTQNGDAIYIPPPDTVLDTMWVQDSLIIPISYSYTDTILRQNIAPCPNSSVHLTFSVGAVGNVANWNTHEISLAGALNGPDFPQVTLYHQEGDEFMTPITEQYTNASNQNYYFTQSITQPGHYALHLAQYDIANTLTELAISAYILQSGESESRIVQADSTHLTLTCSTAIVFEDSLPSQSATWSEPLTVRSGDSLWGDYSSMDSLNTYLIQEQQLTAVLQSLVQQQSLDSLHPLYSSILYNSTTHPDTLAVRITQNAQLLLLIFNPSASSQHYNALVKQIIEY